MPTGPDLHEQLSWRWGEQVRPRLEGLTEDELHWHPAPGCWDLREGHLDGGWPTPTPAPLTTIAWRLGHLGLLLSHRASAHFGDRSYVDVVPTDVLGFVDDAYAAWARGIVSAEDARFARPHQGPPGSSDQRYPFWAVVLHVNSEVIHHGAEVALLRDLYRARR